MNRAIFAFAALMAIFGIYDPAVSETLTYEGKAIAQMTRSVEVPFPVFVDQVLVKTGEDVKKGQRLVEYHLSPREARHLQYEIISGGQVTDIKEHLAAVDSELASLSAQRATSSELAAKGLASQAAAGKDARVYNAAQQRRQAILQKNSAAKTSFELRLEELKSYFGVPVKAGARLPSQLFMTSPIDGTIIEIASKTRPMGELEANASAMTVAILNPIQVQMQVYETEITRIRVGEEVTVEVANQKDVKLHGRISTISWQPTDTTIAVPSFYFVYVDVDNPEHFIKPGYKVWVKVEAQ